MQYRIILSVFFLLHLFLAPIAAANQKSRDSEVDSLDPENRNYMHDFCAYHPSSPICIIKPNPPARPPFTPPGSSSGDWAGIPTTPPPPPVECTSPAPANAIQVSSLPAAISAARGGKTAILPVGNYPALNISGSFGGGTIRCAQAGKCNAAPNGMIKASDLTVEGFTIKGGNKGVTLNSARNVTVRCSNFIETENSGVLLDQGGAGCDQIKIHLNNFVAVKTGCHITQKGLCGTLSNGTPIASMDYGIRMYDTGTVDIQKNTFGTLFNHSISTKSNVRYAYVAGNTFNQCGRNCIEPGQEPNTTRYPNRTSDEIVITGNTFNNVIRTATVILVKNVRKVTFTNNRLNNVQGRLINMYNFEPGKPWSSGGTVIGNGVPANRVVINSGNN